jgi:hypothetical protein
MPEECRGWLPFPDPRYSQGAVDIAEAIQTARVLPVSRHEETLRCLEALWLKRDGAASWELAEAYIRVLIENPSLFISHVAAKHELYPVAGEHRRI